MEFRNDINALNVRNGPEGKCVMFQFLDRAARLGFAGFCAYLASTLVNVHDPLANSAPATLLAFALAVLNSFHPSEARSRD